MVILVNLPLRAVCVNEIRSVPSLLFCSRQFSRVNEMLAVERNSRGQTLLVKDEMRPLVRGEVLLKVHKFALTANTVTYATVGDKFKYWWGQVT